MSWIEAKIQTADNQLSVVRFELAKAHIVALQNVGEESFGQARTGKGGTQRFDGFEHILAVVSEQAALLICPDK